MLIIPVLTSFVHMEYCIFVPFHLGFDAISGSLICAQLTVVSRCKMVLGFCLAQDSKNRAWADK